MPNLVLNDGQRAKLRDAINEERGGLEANAGKLNQLLLAEQEPGFSGSLRRAISRSQRPIVDLAAEVTVDPRVLDAFRAGAMTLPSDVVDRLVDVLHLRLVAELV